MSAILIGVSFDIEISFSTRVVRAACVVLCYAECATSSQLEVKRYFLVRERKFGGPPLPEGMAGELSVGEVAKRSGVAVSTLHFYEAEGLIQSWRNKGNQRRYPREVLRRVAVIKVAQRTGIPLASIRKALATLPNARTPTAQDWAKLSSRWKAELDARIEELSRLRDQLAG